MTLRLEILDSLASVDAVAWDQLVPRAEPFCEHAFLRALETSESVGPSETGWEPRHLCVYDGTELVAACPLYRKTNSFGEFIFDFGWADAARRAGIRYYPKLVSAVPFTPVTGRRLLVRDDSPRRDALRRLLATAAKDLAASEPASSVHVLFGTEDERDVLASTGYLPRLSYQYHFHNEQGWTTFDQYLGAMRSATRKQVRRERRVAREHGLTLSVRTGSELGDAEWRALAELYASTCRDHGSYPYLTPRFFDEIRRTFSHRVVATFAHRGEEPVAGAIFFHRDDALYGRYWGSYETLECMHFELCYYLPIEWGLARGMRRFEAGAQGEHKVKRGLLSTPCHSAHQLRHPGLAQAVADFLAREAMAVEENMDAVDAELSPFRRGPEGG